MDTDNTVICNSSSLKEVLKVAKMFGLDDYDCEVYAFVKPEVVWYNDDAEVNEQNINYFKHILPSLKFYALEGEKIHISVHDLNGHKVFDHYGVDLDLDAVLHSSLDHISVIVEVV